MSTTVAIIGRPNVGKSTLFNRLVGRRVALVSAEPGVTRDRREGTAHLFDLSFTVIDTAGLEEADGAALETRMRAQSERALAEADLALLLIDARAGVTPVDRHFADVVRRAKTPVVLVANKCEGAVGEAGRFEAFALGLGDPVAVSAEHALGLGDLRDAIAVHLADKGMYTEGETETETETETRDRAPSPAPLQLAIVGRPNVGKSTLVNRLLGEERVLTGPEVGITRDAIAVEWSYKDHAIRLIDTAGLRRKSRVSERLERLSTSDTLRAIRYAHVVVLVIDAAAPMEKQDLTIAAQAIEEGRGLVIAVNKWDVCTERARARAMIDDRLQRSLPQVRGIPVVTISALYGDKLERLLDAVIHLYDVWNRRVGTPALNRWLAAMTAAHPPPAPGGRRIKLRYMTQPKSRPPTFVIFCSKPGDLPDSYLRYLENGLREAFELPGTPLRLSLRKGDNPYAPKGRRKRKSG